MWSKNECSLFFSKILGVDLTSVELDGILDELSKNNLSPNSQHGTWNMGFSPLKLQEFINLTLKRTDININSSRFKKVNEEIFPAIYFCLMLKKIGRGEFLIVSHDVPDISLVPFPIEQDNNKKIIAYPLEAIFLNSYIISKSEGRDCTNQISEVIINKKFNKQYTHETILLITINVKDIDINIEKLSCILCNQINQPFHLIYIFFNIDNSNIVIAQLFPHCEVLEFDIKKDLLPLIY